MTVAPWREANAGSTFHAGSIVGGVATLAVEAINVGAEATTTNITTTATSGTGGKLCSTSPIVTPAKKQRRHRHRNWIDAFRQGVSGLDDGKCATASAPYVDVSGTGVTQKQCETMECPTNNDHVKSIDDDRVIQQPATSIAAAMLRRLMFRQSSASHGDVDNSCDATDEAHGEFLHGTQTDSISAPPSRPMLTCTSTAACARLLVDDGVTHGKGSSGTSRMRMRRTKATTFVTPLVLTPRVSPVPAMSAVTVTRPRVAVAEAMSAVIVNVETEACESEQQSCNVAADVHDEYGTLLLFSPTICKTYVEEQDQNQGTSFLQDNGHTGTSSTAPSPAKLRSCLKTTRSSLLAKAQQYDLKGPSSLPKKSFRFSEIVLVGEALAADVYCRRSSFTLQKFTAESAAEIKRELNGRLVKW